MESKNKAQIAVVCNNFGESYDGIGSYSRIIYEIDYKDIQTTIYSGLCRADKGKLHKLTSLGMTNAFIKLMRDIRRNKGQIYDAVVIEYPFMEWNPLVYISLFALSMMGSKYGFKIITSVHEYSRVNHFRKRIIEYLCSISDSIFVTNKEMQSELERYCSKSFIRDIPTNIYADNLSYDGNKDKRQYVYFGLVGKTKAFDEMLDGWSMFNRSGKYTLHILSGTKLEGMDKYEGVNYIYNCSEEEILHLMSKSVFCVVPIRPYVDGKNATFKTGCLGGCISIGKFGEEYSELKFVINMDNYSADEFRRQFARTQEIDDVKLKEMQKNAYDFGSRFTPVNIAVGIERHILQIINGDSSN